MQHLTLEELDARLKTILKAFSKPEAAEIAPGDELRARFDSLAILEMVFRFEDEFGIEIDTAKLHELQTYGDLLKAVEGLVKSRADKTDPGVT